MPRWPTSEMPMIDRFWTRVDQAIDGCWMWKGKTNWQGYGRFWAGHETSAHIFSWELAHGAVPIGKFVLHHCDQPSCVRPDHLFLGTQLTNMRDKINKGRRVLAINEGMPTFKLTSDQVLKIRENKSLSQAALARQYGVHQSTISRIIAFKRRRWAAGTHVTGV